MTLQEEIARHASLLCERELDRRQGVVRSPAVGEAVYAVALQVARGIADAAANDEAVRCALESIYACSAPVVQRRTETLTNPG